MAKLRVYTNPVEPRTATKPIRLAAAEASAPFQVGAQAANLAAGWAQWREANKQRDALAKTGLILSERAVEWERTKSAAQAQGFYDIDGEMFGLIEGEREAFYKHREETLGLLNEIEDDDFRDQAIATYTAKAYEDEILLEESYRARKQEAQKVAVTASAEQLSEVGRFDEAEVLLRRSAESGILSAAEYSSARTNAVSKVRENKYRELLAITDDMEGLISDMMADPYLSEDAKDELASDLYARSEQIRVNAERAEDERQEQNLSDFLATTDPRTVSNSDINSLDIPEGDKQAYMLNNWKAANDPGQDDPDAVERANDLIEQAVFNLITVGEAQIGIAKDEGLSSATSNDLIRELKATVNSAMANPMFMIERDYMASQILGVPEAQFNVLNDTQRSLGQVWGRARRDMYAAAREQGPAFDPVQWRKDNFQGYLEEAERVQGQQKREESTYMVSDKTGRVLKEETLSNISRAFPGDEDKQEAEWEKVLDSGRIIAE